jgi:hypothetical protein
MHEAYFAAAMAEALKMVMDDEMKRAFTWGDGGAARANTANPKGCFTIEAGEAKRLLERQRAERRRRRHPFSWGYGASLVKPGPHSILNMSQIG